MRAEETTKQRRRAPWILGGLAVAMVGLVVLLKGSPDSQYAFLSKYQIVERRVSEDSKLAILVLKGDIGDVWRDIRHDFAGKPVFISTGILPAEGISPDYRSLGTQEGLIKLSNDLGFANEGFGTRLRKPEFKSGYCAVAFTPSKTILDRVLDWMR